MPDAPSHDFLRTEAIRGRSSEKKVQLLVDSMKTSGWIGEPVVVIVINAEKYIIDGHHRVFAARIVGLRVPYSVIADQDLVNFQYSSTDQVIQAYAEAGPNSIRLRR